MQVVYHTIGSHRNPLTAKVVVLGHAREAGQRFGAPGVTHVVGGNHTEGKVRAGEGRKLVVRRFGVGEDTLPRAAFYLYLQVVVGDAGLGIGGSPDEGDGGGGDAARDLQPHFRRGGVASDGEGLLGDVGGASTGSAQARSVVVTKVAVVKA